MKLITQDTETVTETGGNNGDYDLGREFSKRFVWQGDDGKYRVATVSYWVEARDGENKEVKPEDEDELVKAVEEWQARRENFVARRRFDQGFHKALERWDDENPRPISYHWCEKTETAVCDDPEEIDAADIEYGDGSEFYYNTKAEAEDYAKGECNAVEAEHFNPKNF